MLLLHGAKAHELCISRSLEVATAGDHRVVVCTIAAVLCCALQYSHLASECYVSLASSCWH